MEDEGVVMIENADRAEMGQGDSGRNEVEQEEWKGGEGDPKGFDGGKDGTDVKMEENVVVELDDEDDEEGDGSEDDEEDGSEDDADSFINDDGDEEADEAVDAEEDELNCQVQLTDAEIEDMFRELLEVESRAAEAQEALEKESLGKVESEVRAELAQSLEGDELENAIMTEMSTFMEQWKTVLDGLETESSLLLEQLDGAGIELPSLFKLIESQASSTCHTEAWRKRTHWAGSEVTSDTKEAITSAEKFLQSCRPVRRQHGKLLEEGAGGYLARKLPMNDGGDDAKGNVGTWNSFNEFITSHKNSEGSLSFGSRNWASVYLATTPRQAANLGLKLPGVDEVEEIDEIQVDSLDPFIADAIQNELDIELSEEQKRNFRKVTEENDANTTRKLQHFLKRRRLRRRHRQKVASEPEEPHCRRVLEKNSAEDIDLPEEVTESPMNSCGSTAVKIKSCQAVVLDSEDEVEIIEKIREKLYTKNEINSISANSTKDAVDVINIDAYPSPSPHRLLPPTEVTNDLHCTACLKVLPASEVHRHILLDVIVCERCNSIVEERMQKDIDSTQCYCRWCGKGNDLVHCSFCKMSFCSTCLCRNLGEEELFRSKLSSWHCCHCEPSPLHKLVMECNRAFDIIAATSSSGSEYSDSVSDSTGYRRKRKRKRKIRRILDDAELGEETKQKIEIEKARQEHLKSMKYAQQSFNNVSFDEMNGEGANIEILGDAETGYIVNVFRESDEDAVRIPPSTSIWLKPYQVAGIRFMWQNIIQSVKKVKSGDRGLGCILAHTMGLGKTFQVITLLYAAMRSVDLGLKTVLIVTPVNVLHNWRQEFTKWKPSELKRLRVYMLEDVPRDKRTHLLSKWNEKGGVLLIGYAAFRNLSLGKYIKDRGTALEICYALQNIPDILVCDEAHMIKNKRADTTQTLKQIKTQRRIALTGSPLQNNLMEYYCMVDFVREGFLGSSHEFRNRFQNPIENGQHANSTADDVKIMNQRSHILYEQLKGFVQRMDLNVVKNDLPPKTVYVISVKLSPLQRKLYKRFLDVHGFTSEKFSSEKGTRRSFFSGYQALAQIWNHPGLLQKAKEHRENLTREDIVENFFEDDSSSDDNADRGDAPDGDRRNKKDYLQKGADRVFLNEEIDWWQDLLREKIYKEPEYSGKMVLLLDVLKMSSEIGDKVLIFSQSLATLDLIELFLSKMPRRGIEGKYWKQGKDWYRLDGRTAGVDRQKLVERFNDGANTRVKCTLISTRAGSLGINLYAANRVVIVDGSWNPTNDLQAIYRAWRYGQVKPVYAYRLMAHATMEEKIYKRQVTKEGLAARVVDRQQIHRTMSREEVLHLFEFGDDEIAEMGLDDHEHSDHYPNGSLASFLKQKSLSQTNEAVLSDKLMENLLNKHHQRWIQDYHEHEMLLQENEDEKLSKEEQDMAWETFLQSLQWEEVNRVPLDERPTTSEQKPPNPAIRPEHKAPPSTVESRHHPSSHHQGSTNGAQARSSSRSSRPPSLPRKCSNLSHLLTLRSQGTKSGSSTICGECFQEISWENLNRDGRIK